MSLGGAFLDYANDGWIYICLAKSVSCDFYEPSQSLRNVVWYHNHREGTFTDIIKKAGMGGDAYGIGVAVGDCDGRQLG